MLQPGHGCLFYQSFPTLVLSSISFWEDICHTDKIFAIQDEQKKIRDQFLSKQRDELRKHDLLPEKDRKPRARRLVELNLNNDDAILTYNNQVEVFTDGPTLFDNLVENINQAKEMIDVEFYTFYDDHLGNRVLTALEAAQKRVVKVRVILRCQ